MIKKQKKRGIIRFSMIFNRPKRFGKAYQGHHGLVTGVKY
jgi:hypothetical protein